MGRSWRLAEDGGLTIVLCEALEASGLGHVFSTRRADGEGAFDLGTAGDRAATTLRRRKRLLCAAGIFGTAPAVLRQVHGNRVVRVGEIGDAAVEADAVVWAAGDPAGPVPAVRTADCVPILLADRRGRAAAAVHAGWRGTAAGIAVRALERLAELGVEPGEVLAALGPAIGGCCYEVGPEVTRALAGDRPAGGQPEVAGGAAGPSSRIDLCAINRRQLARSGVPGRAIHVAPWCTRCEDGLFFSYRRDGRAAGRMMALIGPTYR